MDVLVGVSLLVLVFSGIFGAYQLGLRVLRQAQHRVVATAVLNQFLESSRNISYDRVGVQGGYPAGDFLSSQTVSRNGALYIVFVDINYVADPRDGVSAPQDTCLNDYKRMMVTVSWQGGVAGSVSGATDIAPNNSVEECNETGGILLVRAFNSSGLAVENASVQVQDMNTALGDVCATSNQGSCQVLLPASPQQGTNYKVTVSRPGYSLETTHISGDQYNGHTIASPARVHATVMEGEVSTMSFGIDSLGALSIETRSSRGTQSFVDPFNNFSLLGETLNVEVENTHLELAGAPGSYASQGYFISKDIAPSSLVSWQSLGISSSVPAGATFLAQILFNNGTAWQSVPNQDLPGNELGFSGSSVSLAGLSVATYPAIRVKAMVTSSNPEQTPIVDEWRVAYSTYVDLPLGTIPLRVYSAKTVGKDSQNQDIFKYDANATTNAQGTVSLSGIEWDGYSISLGQGATGLSLEESNPFLPVAVTAGGQQNIVVYVGADNSLFVHAKDSVSGNSIFSATVHVAKTGFSQDQLTNSSGNAIFMPLEAGTYTVSVAAVGYDSYEGIKVVSGSNTLVAELLLNPQ